MATLLLVIIYLAFISLGLPDSIVGVTWPVMRGEFNLSLEYAGLIALVLTVGTISSSLLSGFIIEKLKTGLVIVFSVALTIIGLLGFYIAPSLWFILIISFSLGFGAGSIDTALNNYVANNYKAHHMNWLHAFWGVGATAGPVIVSFYLTDTQWRKGFLIIALIQVGFLIILTASLPLWKNKDVVLPKETVIQKRNIFAIRGVTYALIIFLAYCALEYTVGFWGSSYLIAMKDLSPSRAAVLVALYYGGITFGRFLSGVLTFKFSNKQMIYGGISVVFAGAVLLLASTTNTMLTVSFVLMGLGLAPIFPSMIHETPNNFGKENSQYVIGYQIAFAYLGTAIFPPLLGLMASKLSISIFPWFLFGVAFALMFSVNALYLKLRTK